MMPVKRLIGGLRALFRSHRVEDELDEELRAYLQTSIEEKMRAGMARTDATRAARIELGSLEAVKDRVRDVGWETRLESIWRDVRYAVRMLRKSPGFTSVAVLTLALGIGANTALFTIVDQVLLRLLPVGNPRELVSVASRGSYYGDTWGSGFELSFPTYVELRDRNDVFAGMFARFSREAQIRIQSRADRVLAEHVTASYFPVLRVSAALGRTLLPSDDAASESNVAVLSYRYWHTALGADPGVIGTTIVANDHALTIVGVAQEGFDGTSLGVASHVFVPIRLVPVLTPVGTTSERPLLDNPRIRWAVAFGRLRPGVNLEQAQAHLQPVYAARLASEVPEEGFARTFVERYLADQPALGTRIGFGRDPGTPTPIEIVGVVADAKYTNVRDDIQPQLYFPLLEGPRVGVVTMYVRGTQDAASMLSTVQRVVRELDPAMPIFDVRTLEDQVARSLSTDRLIANLAAVFGVLATLLAMIGLYGVLAYMVTRLTREIGVRIALGALTRSISWLVLREVLVVIGAGIAVALPSIWGLTGLVKSQLYGVTPTDPAVVLGALAVLTLVGIIAALVPARRATRVDPMVALRAE